MSERSNHAAMVNNHLAKAPSESSLVTALSTSSSSSSSSSCGVGGDAGRTTAAAAAAADTSIAVPDHVSLSRSADTVSATMDVHAPHPRHSRGRPARLGQTHVLRRGGQGADNPHHGHHHHSHNHHHHHHHGSVGARDGTVRKVGVGGGGNAGLAGSPRKSHSCTAQCETVRPGYTFSRPYRREGVDYPSLYEELLRSFELDPAPGLSDQELAALMSGMLGEEVDDDDDEENAPLSDDLLQQLFAGGGSGAEGYPQARTSASHLLQVLETRPPRALPSSKEQCMRTEVTKPDVFSTSNGDQNQEQPSLDQRGAESRPSPPSPNATLSDISLAPSVSTTFVSGDKVEEQKTEMRSSSAPHPNEIVACTSGSGVTASLPVRGLMRSQVRSSAESSLTSDIAPWANGSASERNAAILGTGLDCSGNGEGHAPQLPPPDNKAQPVIDVSYSATEEVFVGVPGAGAASAAAADGMADPANGVPNIKSEDDDVSGRQTPVDSSPRTINSTPAVPSPPPSCLSKPRGFRARNESRVPLSVQIERAILRAVALGKLEPEKQKSKEASEYVVNDENDATTSPENTKRGQPEPLGFFKISKKGCRVKRIRSQDLITIRQSSSASKYSDLSSDQDEGQAPSPRKPFIHHGPLYHKPQQGSQEENRKRAIRPPPNSPTKNSISFSEPVAILMSDSNVNRTEAARGNDNETAAKNDALDKIRENAGNKDGRSHSLMTTLTASTVELDDVATAVTAGADGDTSSPRHDKLMDIRCSTASISSRTGDPTHCLAAPVAISTITSHPSVLLKPQEYLDFYSFLKSKKPVKKEVRQPKTKIFKLQRMMTDIGGASIFPSNSGEAEDSKPIFPRGREVPPGWMPGQHASHPITRISAEYEMASQRPARTKRHSWKKVRSPRRPKRQSHQAASSSQPIRQSASESSVASTVTRQEKRGDGKSKQHSRENHEHSSSDDIQLVINTDFERKRRFYERQQRMHSRRHAGKSGQGRSNARTKSKKVTERVSFLKTIDDICNAAEEDFEDVSPYPMEPYGTMDDEEAEHGFSNGLSDSLVKYYTEKVHNKTCKGDTLCRGSSLTSLQGVRITRANHHVPSAVSFERLKVIQPAAAKSEFWQSQPNLPSSSAKWPDGSPDTGSLGNQKKQGKKNVKINMEWLTHGQIACQQDYRKAWEQLRANYFEKNLSIHKEEVGEGRFDKYEETKANPIKGDKGSSQKKASATKLLAGLKEKANNYKNSQIAKLPPPPDRSEEDQWCYSVNAMLLKAKQVTEHSQELKKGTHRFPRHNSAAVVSPVIEQKATSSFLKTLLKQDADELKRSKAQAAAAHDTGVKQQRDRIRQAVSKASQRKMLSTPKNAHNTSRNALSPPKAKHVNNNTDSAKWRAQELMRSKRKSYEQRASLPIQGSPSAPKTSFSACRIQKPLNLKNPHQRDGGAQRDGAPSVYYEHPHQRGSGKKHLAQQRHVTAGSNYLLDQTLHYFDYPFITDNSITPLYSGNSNTNAIPPSDKIDQPATNPIDERDGEAISNTPIDHFLPQITGKNVTKQQLTSGCVQRRLFNSFPALKVPQHRQHWKWYTTRGYNGSLRYKPTSPYGQTLKSSKQNFKRAHQIYAQVVGISAGCKNTDLNQNAIVGNEPKGRDSRVSRTTRSASTSREVNSQLLNVELGLDLDNFASIDQRDLVKSLLAMERKPSHRLKINSESNRRLEVAKTRAERAYLTFLAQQKERKGSSTERSTRTTPRQEASPTRSSQDNARTSASKESKIVAVNDTSSRCTAELTSLASPGSSGVSIVSWSNKKHASSRGFVGRRRSDAAAASRRQGQRRRVKRPRFPLNRAKLAMSSLPLVILGIKKEMEAMGNKFPPNQVNLHGAEEYWSSDLNLSRLSYPRAASAVAKANRFACYDRNVVPTRVMDGKRGIPHPSQTPSTSQTTSTAYFWQSRVSFGGSFSRDGTSVDTHISLRELATPHVSSASGTHVGVPVASDETDHQRHMTDQFCSYKHPQGAKEYVNTISPAVPIDEDDKHGVSASQEGSTLEDDASASISINVGGCQTSDDDDASPWKGEEKCDRNESNLAPTDALDSQARSDEGEDPPEELRNGRYPIDADQDEEKEDFVIRVSPPLNEGRSGAVRDGEDVGLNASRLSRNTKRLQTASSKSHGRQNDPDYMYIQDYGWQRERTLAEPNPCSPLRQLRPASTYSTESSSITVSLASDGCHSQPTSPSASEMDEPEPVPDPVSAKRSHHGGWSLSNETGRTKVSMSEFGPGGSTSHDLECSQKAGSKVDLTARSGGGDALVGRDGKLPVVNQARSQPNQQGGEKSQSPETTIPVSTDLMSRVSIRPPPPTPSPIDGRATSTTKAYDVPSTSQEQHCFDRKYLRSLRPIAMAQDFSRHRGKLLAGLKAVVSVTYYMPGCQVRAWRLADTCPLVLKVHYCSSSGIKKPLAQSDQRVSQPLSIFYTQDNTGGLRSIFTVRWLERGVFTLEDRDVIGPAEHLGSPKLASLKANATREIGWSPRFPILLVGKPACTRAEALRTAFLARDAAIQRGDTSVMAERLLGDPLPWRSGDGLNNDGTTKGLSLIVSAQRMGPARKDLGLNRDAPLREILARMDDGVDTNIDGLIDLFQNPVPWQHEIAAESPQQQGQQSQSMPTVGQSVKGGQNSALPLIQQQRHQYPARSPSKLEVTSIRATGMDREFSRIADDDHRGWGVSITGIALPNFSTRPKLHPAALRLKVRSMGSGKPNVNHVKSVVNSWRPSSTSGSATPTRVTGELKAAATNRSWWWKQTPSKMGSNRTSLPPVGPRKPGLDHSQPSASTDTVVGGDDQLQLEEEWEWPRPVLPPPFPDTLRSVKSGVRSYVHPVPARRKFNPLSRRFEKRVVMRPRKAVRKSRSSSLKSVSSAPSASSTSEEDEAEAKAYDNYGGRERPRTLEDIFKAGLRRFRLPDITKSRSETTLEEKEEDLPQQQLGRTSAPSGKGGEEKTPAKHRASGDHTAPGDQVKATLPPKNKTPSAGGESGSVSGGSLGPDDESDYDMLPDAEQARQLWATCFPPVKFSEKKKRFRKVKLGFKRFLVDGVQA